jgi:hypothetical protein
MQPVAMPYDVAERATQAWHRSLHADHKADSLANGLLRLSAEISQFAMAADVDRKQAREDRVSAASATNSLTRAVQELRERFDGLGVPAGKDGPPTLPEIIVESFEQLQRRDSDARKLKLVRGFQASMKKGLSKFVEHSVVILLGTAIGFLIRHIMLMQH